MDAPPPIMPIIGMPRVISTAVGRAPYLDRTVCRYVNFESLTEARFYEPLNIGIITAYTRGNWLRENYENPLGFSDRIRIGGICGEYGAFKSTPATGACRQDFIMAMRYYLAFVEGAVQPAFEHEPVVALNENRTLIEQLEDVTLRVVMQNGLQVFVPGTMAEAYECAIAQIPSLKEENLVPPVTDIVVCLFVAITKRSQTTDAYLDKVRDAVKAQIGRDVRLNSQVIQDYYSHYVTNTDPEFIREFMRAILLLIPPQAIVLRNMVEQSRMSGLTSYVLIRQALQQYADFEWGVVEVIRPGSFGAFRDAAVAIGGDEYYAFRTTGMGNAAATKYPVLAWTARSLLIESGGNNTLKAYGPRYNKQQYPRIAAAIERYVNRPLAVNDDGTLALPDDDYWEQARAYAATLTTYITDATTARNANAEPPANPAAPDFGPVPEVE